MVMLTESDANSESSSRDQTRRGHTLGWLVLACALITLIVCVFSWAATYGLLPERALASGESMLAADYSPWEGYRVLNLDVANLATAAAMGDAPWQGEGTPMIVATLPPVALLVTPIEITSQATPLPTLAPTDVPPTRRPVLPRATRTLPPTIPGATATAVPTVPPPAPTSPPPAPTSPPPVPTTSVPPANTDTPTPTPDTPTPTVETATPTATNVPGDTTNPPNGTITARGDNSGPGEGMTQAFDNSSGTKWLDFSPNPNFASWIQYMYPGNQTYTVTQYTITSANDSQERDPYNWRFYGIDDLGNATLLDTQLTQTFSGRFTIKLYTISNSTAYRGYRLEIDSVRDPATANSVQLSEIELIGY